METFESIGAIEGVSTFEPVHPTEDDAAAGHDDGDDVMDALSGLTSPTRTLRRDTVPNTDPQPTPPQDPWTSPQTTPLKDATEPSPLTGQGFAGAHWTASSSARSRQW